MIKASKPKRYSSMTKISREAIDDKNLINLFKRDLKKIKRLPKNTLKAKFIGVTIAQDGTDFIFNILTMKADFEVITFKRK